MRSWPPCPARLDMEVVLEPLLRALNTLRHKGEAVYDGYTLGRDLLAVTYAPDHWFTREGFASWKDQGRTWLELGLTLTFQLGVEQGRRLALQENSLAIRMFERHLDENSTPNGVTPKKT